MNRYKALVTKEINEAGIKLLEKYFDVTVVPAMSSQEMAEIIEPYHLLALRISTYIGRDIIQKAKNLKAIISATAGLDHIDVALCHEKNIEVMDASGGNSDIVAELTIGIIVNLARQICRANNDIKKGEWNRNKYLGKELAYKTLGIIGFGNIGKRVGEIARCLKMDVLFYDTYVSEENGKKSGGTKVSLEELLRRSDVVTIHTPLNAETENLISKKQFEIMKDGAILLNMGRGGIVNEKDLYNALASGKLMGAGGDVMGTEPCTDSPLYGFENFIITPHFGGLVPETQARLATIVAKKAIKLFGFNLDEH